MRKRLVGLVALGIALVAGHFAVGPAVPADAPVQVAGKSMPWEYGVLFQGGKGITDQRDDFKFFMAGVHLGKVLTPDSGKGLLRGNFEYAVELFPYWQSDPPTFQRRSCVPTQNTNVIECSAPYTVGGTFHGAS